MKGIYLVRTVNVTLVPAYPSDYDIVRAIPKGELILADLKLDRNPSFHRKFFALLKFFREHLPEELTQRYKTSEDFRHFVMYYSGITNEFVDFKGITHIVPKSLSFGSMDDIEFAQVYKTVRKEMVDGFFGGDTTEEFEAQLADFM